MITSRITSYDIINCKAREKMYLVASVRPFVTLWICLSELFCLNCLTQDLVGQGQRLRSNAQNRVLISLLVAYDLALRSNVVVKVKCLAGSVQYQGPGLPSAVKANYPQIWGEGGYYQSEGFVYVSVIRGCSRSALRIFLTKSFVIFCVRLLLHQFVAVCSIHQP